MSKARELAELSRTVSDSADAVALTIDSSENVTFANDIAVTGVITSTKGTFTAASLAPLVLNRLTDQGKLIEIQQAGTVRGLAGTVANDLFVCSADSGHNGLRFHANGILPTDNTGAIVDADADLGISTHRFKDLYLSGDALIGGITGSADGTLKVKSNSNHLALALEENSGNEAYQLGVVADGSLIFANSGTEVARLTDLGSFLMGETSPVSASRFLVSFDGTSFNGMVAKTTRSATGTSFHVFVNSSDQVAGVISHNGSTTVNYGTSSDQRLKENIVDAPSASNDIDAIQVRSFNWRTDGEHEKYGFIAQELKLIAPKAVSGMGMPDEEDPMLGVDPSKLIPMLVKEIQSLRARVAQLEAN